MGTNDQNKHSSEEEFPTRDVPFSLKGLLQLGLVIVGIAGLTWIGVAIGYKDHCDEQQLTSWVDGADNRRVVSVRSTCRNTGTSTVLFWESRDHQQWNRGASLLVLWGEHQVEAQWDSSDSISITYPGEAKVIAKRSVHEGVGLNFQPTPVPEQSGEDSPKG